MGARVPLRLFAPIEHGSNTIEEISFRRLVAKDLRQLRDPNNLTMNEQLDLISKLSGQPTVVIDQLDATDVEKAGEIIFGFLGRGQPTGESSSP